MNPLDRQIETFAREFSKIPDFQKKMQDQELRQVHSLVALSMVGMKASTELVIQSFLPAVERKIEETKRYIRTSKYKGALNQVTHDFNKSKFDTIRYGYVTLFHKYEVFVKDLLEMYDKFLPASGDNPEPFERYCKRRFKFDAKKWYRFPSVHKVNFVSNCTKHQDGKCVSEFPLPEIYSHLSPCDYINNSAQDLRGDCKDLLDSIAILVMIYGYCMQIRMLEVSIEEDETAYTTEEEGQIYSASFIASMLEFKRKSIAFNKKMIEIVMPHVERAIKLYEGDYLSPMPKSDLAKLKNELELMASDYI
ncbi:MAG: hypothetical protein JNL72_15505 [Flavipsychrobacter sp.]|nr:hypothetical protein [Flavipsychrobacter sp.]